MSPTPRSRPARPERPALSRAWIIEETLKIIRTEGLDKVTMRRVAQAVGTGPASLYVYVANTAELHAAVLDELLGSLPDHLGGTGNWQDRLEALMGDYAQLLYAHPGLARSALVLRPSGPNTVRLWDQLLGLLLEGGVEATRAAWGVDLLLLHVTAVAAEHSAPTASEIDAPADDEAEWDAMRQAVHTADPATAPHLAAHAEAMLAGTPAQRDTWALRALVAGIASSPDPLTPNETH